MSDKKKKNLAGTITHPRLGKMTYFYNAWHPMSSIGEKVPLWGKIFEADLNFMTEGREQEINPLQEEAYEKFERLMVWQNDVIEQMIRNHFRVSAEEAETRFIPAEVCFGRRGECLLRFQDTEMKEEEYGDDVFLGFTLFLLPRLSLSEDGDAFFYMHRCWEGEKVTGYMLEFGRDPIQDLWEEDDIEINADGVSEEERKEKENRFRSKYGQALQKYEEERAEREKQWQERYDSIEMPKLIDSVLGLLRAAFVFIPLWGLLIWVMRFSMVILVIAIPFAFITVGLLVGFGIDFSDYVLSGKDPEVYRDKILSEENARDRAR